MNCRLLGFMALLAITAFAAGAAAQPMTGTYTIANGNPGSAYDFGDVGAAFDALETSGLSGPVVLELHDTGGAFTSSDAYRLGVSGSTFTVTTVSGISSTNTLTIRAATGNSPVIDAGTTGALNTYTSSGGTGCMAFRNIGNITLEGITFTGATQFGVMWYSSSSGSSDNLVIHKCRFHSISAGAAIFLYGSSSSTGAVNVDIENNMIWDVHGDASWAGGGRMGVIGARRLGANVRVRHNTILMNSTGSTSAVFQLSGGTANGFADLSYNVVHVVAAAYFYQKISTSDPLPVNADRNVIFEGSAAMTNEASLTTWAHWQAAGFDANGVNADPQLASTTAPFDLYLLTSSPAVDLAVGSTTADDIDGDVRPNGAAPDSGADEAGDPPDMYVAYNASAITDGTSVNVGDARTQVGDTFTFEIGNVGLGDLHLTGTPAVELIQGTNNAGATGVQTQPGLLIIPQFGTTTFVINIEPTAVGPFDLTIQIMNNDKAKSPYDFTVSGMGILPNDAATAAPAAGSSFAGPVNGPFEMSIDPAATLAAATIELSDIDLDNIVVSGITAITAVPTGVTAPSIPPAGHPILLSWTGMIGPTNTPGAYTWEVDFADTVNLTPVTIEVTIVINDLPPVHTLLNAVSGDGSSGNPYLANYFGGATGASSVDLATVADPNTGQLLSLSAVVQVSGPDAGTGFQFNLSAGVLAIAPAGTLVDADAGNQSYTVVVSDGLHSVLIRVDAFVFGSSGKMYFLNSPSLPSATQDVAYGPIVLQVDGGTAPYSFSEISGSLPPGITLNTTTGEISGTSSVLGLTSVTIRVIDAGNDTLTGTFSLRVRPPAGKGGVGGSSSSNDGGSCSTAPGGVALWALLVFGAIAAMRYTRRRA